MKLYKAHFLHPYTHVPLIVYFNESNGVVSFEKDEEMIKLIWTFEKEMKDREQFIANIEKASYMCQSSYSVPTFDDVFEFLGKLGLRKEDLQFKQVLIH
ncbi:hypothetical protein [Halalkalibacterium ligniniphilum]|uniref:hypothetical protein n=1 Tax=Halalkalibacterium ligniniphilum TaxID=1134413 RepID=UPI0003486671|nr:hypothetical protein [Halalkalibacterium ligniniphilum]